MFNKTTLALCALLACLAAPSLSVVSAQTYHFTVVLDGAQAGTTSQGTGTANVLVDSVSGDISVDGSFTGLDGIATAAHLHLLPGGPPIYPFSSLDRRNAGNFLSTGTIADPAELARVIDGESYINIHSTAFRPGEIWGNLLLANRTEVFEPGDVNRDGSVDFLDIAPFVALLSSGEYQPEADFDGNFLVNSLDIAPFITELSNQ